MMGRCVIIGGADINNYGFIREQLCVDDYSFFSLLNISGCAKDITITGAKYPLAGAEISCEYQYGVSNEVLPGEVATVSVTNGKLLLINIRK